jgi:tRNA threonylcarbamoyladenosine biosynthesis protein TsaE
MRFDVHGPHAASVDLEDEMDTLALGARLATGLEPGLIVYLRGDLGAGKTTLVRGVLRGLGYDGRVKSPTYTLVEDYRLSRLYLHHFDFYRFKDPAEWLDAGFRDSFTGRAVCLVEWPEKVGDLLPAADLEVNLEPRESGRTARLDACSEAGTRCLQRLTA